MQLFFLLIGKFKLSIIAGGAGSNSTGEGEGNEESNVGEEEEGAHG